MRRMLLQEWPTRDKVSIRWQPSNYEWVRLTNATRIVITHFFHVGKSIGFLLSFSIYSTTYGSSSVPEPLYGHLKTSGVTWVWSITNFQCEAFCCVLPFRASTSRSGGSIAVVDDAEESNGAILRRPSCGERVTNKIEECNKGKSHRTCIVLIRN